MTVNFLPVQDLINKLENNNLTIHEIMKIFYNKIDEKNDEINAIISKLSYHGLDKQLNLSEKRRMENKRLSPLDGLPIAIKDLEETQGILTTSGSKVFQNNIPKIDSQMVHNLKKSGCIIIGKTNVPEFGIGSQTYNTIFGSTKNPFDTKLTSGGSSGGAAAAVSAGMIPFADGSDMMGSLRNPASFCSVFGYRPTPGLIPSKVTSKIFPKLSTLGPIGKTTKCLTYLLDAQVGNFFFKKNKNNLFSELVDNLPKKQIKIAWLGNFNGSYLYENEIKEICEDFLKNLESHQFKIEDLPLKFNSQIIWESWINLRSLSLKNDLYEIFKDKNKVTFLKPEIIWEIERALTLSSINYEQAIYKRTKWKKYTDLLFKRFDFLALPSTQVFPFLAKVKYPSEINGKNLDTYHRWMEVVVPASLIGLPTISIPCGFNTKGLPIGIQLIGKYGNDKEVLCTSNLIEKSKIE
tara:strand:- start:747 stop:2138 length:1392 start_codon:yes stop_codon:yes gene_type:complete